MNIRNGYAIVLGVVCLEFLSGRGVGSRIRCDNSGLGKSYRERHGPLYVPSWPLQPLHDQARSCRVIVINIA
jgi:hypothetical protein